MIVEIPSTVAACLHYIRDGYVITVQGGGGSHQFEKIAGLVYMRIHAVELEFSRQSKWDKSPLERLARDCKWSRNIDRPMWAHK